jgi:hypothetical protein
MVLCGQWEEDAMRPNERELAAEHLSQIADEIGLELGPERLERVLGLLESAVDGVRATTELGLDGREPALVPDLGPQQDR